MREVSGVMVRSYCLAYGIFLVLLYSVWDREFYFKVGDGRSYNICNRVGSVLLMGSIYLV